MAERLAPQRVLVVEHLARRRHGHYMARLKDVSEHLAADGHEVHVLTAYGLAIEDEGGELRGVRRLHRPARHWLALHKLGVRLWPEVAAVGPTPRRSLPRRVVGVAVRQIADVRGVAACARSLGSFDDTAVIVLSPRVHVGWAAALAPLRARWTVHAHRLPPDAVAGAAVIERAGRTLARRREQRRRARGGHVDFLCGNPTFAAAWAERFPWLAPEIVLLSGAVDVEPIPKAEARAELGLDPDATIGLQFGGAHAGKDLETTFLAFAGADAPAHLVAAGQGVDLVFERVHRDHPGLEFPHVTVLGGAQPDRVKRLLHSAADFAVLSFLPAWASDSGTLKDAVAYEMPVCCSESSFPETLVREYSLGVTFPPGDVAALRAAIPTIERSCEFAKGVARFREQLSTTSLVRAFLQSAVSGSVAS